MEPPAPKMTPPPPRPAKGYALRFISGKYQGGEFPLAPNREIVVGRSSELDMVLVEDMVSRRHAKITVNADQIFIQDLGSTNGTFVNGEKIKRAKLNEGDRILIGTSIIKLVATEPVTNTGAAEMPEKLEEVAERRRTSQVKTMSGSIEEVPLPDLLQLFSASKKSGVLVVRTEKDVGKLFLDKGYVVFAVVNEHYDVPPLKHAYRILTWTHGTFELDPPEEREFPEKIEMSTEGLLMDGMRHLDEIRRFDGELPPMHANIAIAMPLVPALRDLSPEELDLLQLVYNYGHVETVFNKSNATDLDIATILVKLVKAGYVKAE